MMLRMRTTVTLDPDAMRIIRQLMDERGMSFKAAINDAIRRSVPSSGRQGRRFRTRTASMGSPRIPLDKALQQAGLLEDEELVRKVRRGA